ncbi:hypothetical protein [Tolypothrix sp. VBCCA 56010]|uniref:hypothetical protein n=1 Tax=Tolypothrix sp. VBCCA 56010 TaxID=3137731 RepID=UPI003D7CE549
MYQAKQTATKADNEAKKWEQEEELDDADLMTVVGGFLDVSNNNVYIPIGGLTLLGGGSGGSGGPVFSNSKD